MLNLSAKSKVTILLVAFLVVVGVACGARGCASSAAEEAAETEEQAQEQGAIEATERQGELMEAYGPVQSDVIAILEQGAWVSADGSAQARFEDGAFEVSADGIAAEGQPYANGVVEGSGPSAVIGGTSAGSYDFLLVASDDAESLAHLRQQTSRYGADSVWELSCTALGKGDAPWVNQTREGPIEVAGLDNEALVTLLGGEQRAGAVAEAVSAFSADAYPTATCAAWNGTATLACASGKPPSASLTFVLDNRTQSKLGVTVDLATGGIEIGGL